VACHYSNIVVGCLPDLPGSALFSAKLRTHIQFHLIGRALQDDATVINRSYLEAGDLVIGLKHFLVFGAVAVEESARPTLVNHRPRQRNVVDRIRAAGVKTLTPDITWGALCVKDVAVDNGLERGEIASAAGSRSSGSGLRSGTREGASAYRGKNFK